MTFTRSAHLSLPVALYSACTNKAEMAFKEKQAHQRLLMRAAAQSDPLVPASRTPPQQQDID